MTALSKKEVKFLLVSFGVALILFFYGALNYSMHFVHVADHEYQQFSPNIFQPQFRFYAESILVPLLGKLVGAAKSAYAYQFFTALFQFSILPIVAVLCARRITDELSAWVAMSLFALSFAWLRNYWLGFPDPVTIICLLLVAGAQGRGVVFIFALLASLSHYTLTIFGLLAIFSIARCCDQRGTHLNYWPNVWSVVAALLTGKLVLWVWFFVFRYSPEGRFSHVIKAKVSFFVDQYLKRPFEFWLTPGALFLLINLIIFLFLCFRHRGMAVGQVASLAIAYLCLFLSEDGLRIFSVVISGAYLLLLLNVIPQVVQDAKRVLKPLT